MGNFRKWHVAEVGSEREHQRPSKVSVFLFLSCLLLLAAPLHARSSHSSYHYHSGRSYRSHSYSHSSRTYSHHSRSSTGYSRRSSTRGYGHSSHWGVTSTAHRGASRVHKNGGSYSGHPSHHTPSARANEGGERDEHGKLERSTAAKDSFKRLHPCPSTGKSSGPCSGYVIEPHQASRMWRS